VRAISFRHCHILPMSNSGGYPDSTFDMSYLTMAPPLPLLGQRGRGDVG
jgi:hypothetical protein